MGTSGDGDPRYRRQRAYYRRNKDAIAESHRSYYRRNKDRIYARALAYRQDHKERVAEWDRTYRRRRKERRELQWHMELHGLVPEGTEQLDELEEAHRFIHEAEEAATGG